ncbi:MAG TPA: glycosyltransferase family 39 protein [Acidobacteriota bacterium]|nr:glycosyltransferase family 39 protein [Acidobacteriota bacterium]
MKSVPFGIPGITIWRRIQTAAASRTAVVAVLFSIIINIPFLGQPFHMDDAIYLLLAGNVFRNPLFPQQIGVHVEGIWAPDLASMEHAPLTAYLLAAGVWLGRGIHEIPLHSLFLVFHAILGFSMFSLSQRLTRHPLAATALLMLMPSVFIMSHTLMTDLPHLSMWVLAVALFTKGVDEGHAGRVWGGATAAGLASYISPASLCLVPLLVLYAFLKKRPRCTMPAVVLPSLFQALWWLANCLHYARFTPVWALHYYFATEQVLGLQALSQKGIYAVLSIGGLTLSPVILISSPYRRFLALGLPIGMVLTLSSEARNYPTPLLAAFVVSFAFGFTAVSGSFCAFIDKYRDASERTDDLFLGIWLAGTLLFAVLFYMTGSARYLLPFAPPLVLLVVRSLESERGESGFRILSGAAILTSGLLSVCLGIADFKAAEVYRDFASHLRALSEVKTHRLWFTGEWGFRAYLELLGGQELGRRDARPHPRDLIVVPSVAVPYSTLFDANPSRESIVMIAPSRLSFDVPALPMPAKFLFEAGMPGWGKSDGLDLMIHWNGRLLYSQSLLPEQGKTWRRVEIPLPDSPPQPGSLIFSAQVGASGNADADWVAISHARIQAGGEQLVQFGLREHMSEARINAVPQVNYHTPGNKPVLEMPIWLNQAPAVRLLEERTYTSRWPFRVLDSRWRAGFWSMGWGILPFSFAVERTPIEVIRILEVIRPVDDFGETDPSWYSK